MASGSFGHATDTGDREVEWQVTEWWDSHGEHHNWSPNEDELLDEARQLTVHVWDDSGNDLYFTDFSPDGWEYGELEVDVDDAYDYYG